MYFGHFLGVYPGKKTKAEGGGGKGRITKLNIILSLSSQTLNSNERVRDFTT